MRAFTPPPRLGPLRLLLFVFLCWGVLPCLAQSEFQGSYQGDVFLRMSGHLTQAERPIGYAIAIVGPDGDISVQDGAITGQVDATGTITWNQPNDFSLDAGSISAGTLAATGSSTQNGTTTHTRLDLRLGGAFEPSGSLDGVMNPVNPDDFLTDGIRVIHDGSRFVALATHGTVSSSDDGIHWTHHSTGSPLPLTDLAYGQGTYVAVGEGNALYTSTDLETWTPRASSFLELQKWPITSVAFFQGRFYVGNLAGAIARSADTTGVTWEAPFIPGNVLGSLAGPILRVLNDRLYLSGKGYNAVQSDLRYSTNGTTFTPCTIVADGLYFAITHLAYGNGVYAVTSGPVTATSSDGLTFTKANSPATLSTLAFDGTHFLSRGAASTNTPFFYSTDAVHWSTGPVGSLHGAADIATSGGIRVAVGTEGRRSTDGLSWSEIATSPIGPSWVGPRAEPLNVTYGNGRFILEGTTENVITQDGIEWESAPAQPGIAYGNGIFVSSAAQVSSDGQHWAAIAPGLQPTETIRAIRFDGSQFLLLTTAGRALVSSDGVHWTHANPESPVPYSLHLHGHQGEWIALGSAGAYTRSLDGGVTWSTAYLSNATLTGVAYGNNQWVVVSASGKIYAAPSLAGSFSTIGPNSTPSPNYQSITFIDGQFLAFDSETQGYDASPGIGSEWTRQAYAFPSILGPAAIGPRLALLPGTDHLVHAWEQNHIGHPVVSTQPAASSSWIQDETLQLSAAAFGNATLRYRWFRNGFPLSDGGRVSGATTLNLQITDLRTTDAGTYHFVAINDLGGALSSDADVQIQAKSRILSAPVSQLLTPGDTAHFSVEASADTTAIQWYFNGNPLPGATSANLDISGVSIADVGIYEARLTNPYGDTFSPPASLSFQGIETALGRDPDFEAAQPDFQFANSRADGFLSGRFVVYTAVEQPDGKILVGGQFRYTTSAGTRAGIVRLHPDGSLDESFAIPHLQEYVSGYLYDTAIVDIALASDGTVYALPGAPFTYIDNNHAGRSFRLLKISSAGVVDTTYDPPANTYSYTTFSAIEIDSTDRLYLAGDSVSGAGSSKKNVVRITTAGSIDASFDGRFSQLALASPPPAGFRLLPNGELLMFAKNSNSQWLSQRLTSSGTLSPGFTQANFGANQMGSLVPLENGDFIVAGRFTSVAGASRIGIARFTSTGVLDASFAPGNPYHELYNQLVNGAGELPGGTVIAGGSFALADTTGPVKNLAQFATDGSATAIDSITSLTVDAPSNWFIRSIEPAGDHQSLFVGLAVTSVDTQARARLVKLGPGAPSAQTPSLSILHTSGGGYAEPGDRVTFTASAVGGALTFQWYHQGTAIPGATDPQLILDPVTPDDHGNYTMVAVDDSGRVTSAAISLQVLGASSGYDGWAAAYDLPSGLDGFDDDASGDGVANGFKFLFDLDPTLSSALQIEVPHPSGESELATAALISLNDAAGQSSPDTEAGKSYRIVSFRVPIDMKGLEIGVAASTTLVMSDGSGTAHPLGQPEIDGDFQIQSFYLVPAVEDAPRLFWQLTLTQP
ncbi:putative delta-60 repeat protein [Haloferula luteola]|uniref:Putative delta-60 repeat protein n=1 Tax=Haloferula luteola TaxID=595692 RepID=A0A840V0L5_9BACT|nr:hypothetical protein [Haloferula luteola]MBB5350863.1 putative delta-60 repeat protein [Haloferula luteola]